MKLSFLQIKWRNRFSPQKAIYFWYRNYKVFLFFFFLIVFGCGAFAWYESLYNYHWNDEQKKKFIDSYVRETNFKEARFTDVVERIKTRAAAHQERPSITRNVFTGERY